MLEQIVLGTVQGITEWLPVSSKAILILIKINFFHEQGSLDEMIRAALFLHLGTFAAALIYLFSDVKRLTIGCLSFSRQSKADQNVIVFLVISTILSGALGFTLLKFANEITSHFSSTSKIITALIGFLLIGTGVLQLIARRNQGIKQLSDLKLKDGIILGLAQGLAGIPGLSRSGMTVSALLLLKFDDRVALRLSFLMSLPIVLAGNIILNFDKFRLTIESAVGLLFSFLFGIATIHLLLKIAERINFAYFMFFFGTLTILSILI